MTESASSQVPKPQGYVPPYRPEEGREGDSLLMKAGRTYIRAAMPATRTFAVPFKLAGIVARGLSYMTAWPVTKAVGGIGYVITAPTELALKGARKVADVASKREFVGALTHGTQELVRMNLEEVQAQREIKGEAVQSTIGWARWGGRLLFSVVPGGGLATAAVEGLSDAASKIEEIEREAEKANISAARWHLNLGMDCIRYLAPRALGAASWTLSQTEALTEWMKTKSIQAWSSPEVVGQEIQNLGNVCDAIGDKLWNMSDAMHWIDYETRVGEPPQAPPEINPDEIPFDRVKEFCQLDKEVQKEALFLVNNSRLFALPTEKQQAFRHAVRQVLEHGAKALGNEELIGPLKELIFVYKNMPSSERDKLTPRIFQQQDELTKLQLLQVVRDHAKGLSDEERAFILSPEFRHLEKVDDWEGLDSAKKRNLEAFLIEKFNQLPSEIKQRLYSLTPEQYNELLLQDRKVLLKQVGDRVKEQGSSEEIKRYEALEKKELATQKRDVRLLLHLFNKYFSRPEKFAIYSNFQSEVMLFRASPKEIETLITQQKQAQDLLPAGSEEAKNATQILEWLTSQQAYYAHQDATSVTTPTQEAVVSAPPPTQKRSDTLAPKPFDMAHVQELVGPHVVQGYGEEFGAAWGELVHGCALIPGGAGWLLFRGLAALSEPWVYVPEQFGLKKILSPFLRTDEQGHQYFPLLEKGMSGTARVADIALTFPTMQVMLMNRLEAMGVPAYEINRTLATLPATLLEKIVSAEGYLISLTKEGVRLVDAWTGSIFSLQDYLKMKEKGLDVGKKMGLEFEAALRKEFFTESVAKACEAREAKDRLFICSKEVFDYLSTPAKWPELARNAKVAPDSPEFFNLIQNMAETGRLPEMLQRQAPAAPETLVAVPAAYIIDTVGAVGESIRNRVAGSISGMWNWLADAAGEPGRHFASGVGHIAKGVRKLPVVQQLAEDVAAVGEVVASTADATSKWAQQIVGLRQAMPWHTQAYFDAVRRLTSELAGAQAQEEAYRMAMLALDQAQGTWLLSLAQSEWMGDVRALADSVGPLLQNSLKTLEAMHEASLANADFLNAQIAMNMPVQQAVEVHLDSLAGDAVKALGIDESFFGGKGKSYVNNIFTGLGAIGYLGAGNFFLPLLIQKIGLHALRTAAPEIGPRARPFFLTLAQGSLNAADTTGKALEQGIDGLGSWFKRAFNGVTGFVDAARVDNFQKKLTLDEQKHLIDLAANSRRLPQHVQDKLREFRGKIPNISSVHYKRLAEVTLGAFDRMSTADKLAISASFFEKAEPKTRARIIDIVQEEVGLTAEERQNPGLIVEKFNALPSEIREKVDQMSVYDYGAISSDEREDIRFILAHSKEGKRYFTEQKSYFEQSALFQWGRSDIDLVVEARDTFREIGSLSNQELAPLLPLFSQMSTEERSVLTPSRLRRLGDAKIAHVFEILNKYRPDLIREIRERSDGKYNLFELYRLVTPPAPTGVSDATKMMRANMKNTLIEVLATAFQSLAPQQKAEMLQLTERQFETLLPDRQRQVLTFLLAQKGIEGNYSQLKTELVNLEMKKPLDVHFITSTFNQLQAMQKAEILETLEIGENEKVKLEEGVKKQIAHVEESIKLVQKKMGKLQEKEFLGFQLRLDEAKMALMELPSLRTILPQKKEHIQKLLEAQKDPQRKGESATLQKEIDALKQRIAYIELGEPALKKKMAEFETKLTSIGTQFDKLGIYLKELQAEASCLYKILGKAPQSLEDLEDMPLPPNRMATIEAAVKIAENEILDGVEKAHYKPLEEFKGTFNDFMTQVKFSETHLSNMLGINKKKRKDCQELIETRRKELESSALSPTEKIRKTLEIQTLKTFYIPLFSRIIQKNDESLTRFTARAKEIRSIKFPAALQV